LRPSRINVAHLTPQRPAVARNAAGTPLLSMPKAHTSTRFPPADSITVDMEAFATSRPAPAARMPAAESVSSLSINPVERLDYGISVRDGQERHRARNPAERLR
jgi:hypothetical protein